MHHTRTCIMCVGRPLVRMSPCSGEGKGPRGAIFVLGDHVPRKLHTALSHGFLNNAPKSTDPLFGVSTHACMHAYTCSAHLNLPGFLFPSFAGANLALNQPAWLSSTAAGGEAKKCVDGNRDAQFSAGSVCSSTAEVAPWFKVALPKGARVVFVVVWNREDCCAAQINPFTITLLDAQNNVIAEQQFTSVLSQYIWAIAHDNVGYLKVALDSTEARQLHMAEVEAFGIEITGDVMRSLSASLTLGHFTGTGLYPFKNSSMNEG